MKPTAYEGNEPYIFVSYSHKDYEAVYRVLGELQQRGYRFWYDEGIEPGGEWPESIARHLDAAAMVLAFITPASMRSETCRQEINFSISRSKPLLSIMLEPTNLPLGMEMQLSTKQMIMYWSFERWDLFIDKVLRFPPIAACRPWSAVASSAFAAAPASAPAAQAGTRRDANATVVLDPDEDPAPAGGARASGANAMPYARQGAAGTGRAPAGAPGASAPRTPNGAQVPLSSTGTVWAGSPAGATQPAAQASGTWGSTPRSQQPYGYAPGGFAAGGAQPMPQQPNAWPQAATNPSPAMQQPYGYNQAAYTAGGAQAASGVSASSPQGKRSGKRLPAIIAAAVVAVAAIAALAFGPLNPSGCSGAPGGGSHASSADLAEVVPHPPFMLEDLVSDNHDDTIAMVEDLVGYQDEYGYNFFTADEDMKTFFTETSTIYSDTMEEDMQAYLASHASSLPWRVSVSGSDKFADLDAIENGEAEFGSWNFDGYLRCPDPTSEDVASYVAELFDYDGIVIYRVSTGATSYNISGFAFSDEATLNISAYKDVWVEDGYWTLYAYVTDMDEKRSRATMDSIVYLCEDESHRNQLEDVYFVKPEAGNAVYQDAVDQFDEAAYEAQRHGLSTSIGSDFDTGFDLADLVSGSPADTADALAGLSEVVNTGTYSDGDEWRDVYYTADEDMGKFMMLDMDGDGYTEYWEYPDDHIDSAPYYISLFSEGQYLSRDEIAGGTGPDTATLRGIVPASEPTCEDVARYVREVYGFDQIIIYYDPETEMVEGYAKAGDTTARIQGENNLYDPISTTDVGTYRIYVEAANQENTGQYDSFMEAYNNAQLPERYPDAYKE